MLCTPGAYKTEPPGGQSSAAPTVSGKNTRTDHSIGDWKGYQCTKTVLLTFGSGSSQKMPDEHWVRVHKDDVILSTVGRTQKEADELASEYLDRLG